MKRRRAIMGAAQGWETATVDNIPQFNQNANIADQTVGGTVVIPPSGSRFTFYDNHKYYFSVNFTRLGDVGSIVIYIRRTLSNYRRAIASSATLQPISGIWYNIGEGSTIFGDLTGNSLDGTSCYISVACFGGDKELSNIVVYDLTAIFGAGNEPSTQSQFELLFPNAHYGFKIATENLDGAKKYEYQLLDAQTNTYRYKEI